MMLMSHTSFLVFPILMPYDITILIENYQN